MGMGLVWYFFLVFGVGVVLFSFALVLLVATALMAMFIGVAGNA